MRLLPLIFLLFSLAVSAAEEGEEEAPKKAVYHSLSPSIVANVQAGAKYMRCDVQLLTKDEANLPDIELHTPALRHELLLLFSDQKGSDLKTPEGKENLRKTALKALQGVIGKLSGKKEVIDDLFFTSFFVQ